MCVGHNQRQSPAHFLLVYRQLPSGDGFLLGDEGITNLRSTFMYVLTTTNDDHE